MEDVVVALKLKLSLAVSAGLALAPMGYAHGPQPSKDSAPQAAASADQKIADAVAAKISGTPSLSGLTIEVACEGNVVEVRGVCGDAAQHDAIVKAARATTGVKLVRDGLKVSGIQTVSMQPPGEMLGHPAPMGPGPGMPGPGGVAGPGAGLDPFPLNGGVGGGYNMAPPNMPPYAWPTYAPYNNYSRVATPTEYPASAFPFIGPMYPFPKVPLGYRAIKLEWEDGHWWYGRTAVHRDWWKVRYW
jgi:hypothetical protein